MTKLNILVCEDTPKHLQAAREQLAEHNVLTASSLIEAMQYLGNKTMEDIPGYADTIMDEGLPVPKYVGNIDVVLTDMYMPGGNMPVYSLGDQLAPVGIMIALRAASLGVKWVGLMSDSNHHCDAMTCGIDMLSGTWPTTKRPISINGSKVVISTAKTDWIPEKKESVKSWKWLLDGLLEA